MEEKFNHFVKPSAIEFTRIAEARNGRTKFNRNGRSSDSFRLRRLPDPEVIARLEPRNYKVEAYYLPDSDGNINEVYIYQNGRYLAACKPAPRYNENTAEQTEADREAYTEQAKYVAKFDKMIKEGKIKPLGILSKEASKTVSTVIAEAVETQPADDTEHLTAYLNVSSFERDAMSKL